MPGGLVSLLFYKEHDKEDGDNDIFWGSSRKRRVNLMREAKAKKLYVTAVARHFEIDCGRIKLQRVRGKAKKS